MQVGSVKGENVDKITKFSIKSVTDASNQAIIPEGAAAWMTCDVESSQQIQGYRIFIGRVVSQQDTGQPPLIWHKDGFFSLQEV
jgi:flavin reductase (DIM6/NTAB) family NADH-FMN oxidoreductase RutF